MKKKYLLLFIILFCSCYSSKTTDTQLVCKTKQDAINALEIPLRVFENNADGQIFVYADQFFDQLTEIIQEEQV